MYLLQFLGVVLASLSLGQCGDDCFKSVKLNEGENYNISANQDPSRCYYTFEAPNGSFVTTKCKYSMPETKKCREDQIMYVYSASKATTVCGEGEMNIINLERRFGLGVEVSNNSEYSCTITASRPDNPKNCACGWYPPQLSLFDNEYYPFMAALTLDKVVLSSASIISAHYALTTARGIERLKDEKGKMHLAVKGLKGEVVYYNITAQVHENYNGFYNNIALLKTDKPIAFNSQVGPVCLPFRYKHDSDQLTDTATILGFNDDDMESSEVIATNLTLIPKKECETLLQQKLQREFKCSVANENEKLFCAYNEGSPLVWRWNSSRRSYYLLYLSSLQNPCFTNSINTKITEHLNWIVKNTEGDFLCKRE